MALRPDAALSARALRATKEKTVEPSGVPGVLLAAYLEGSAHADEDLRWYGQKTTPLTGGWGRASLLENFSIQIDAALAEDFAARRDAGFPCPDWQDARKELEEWVVDNYLAGYEHYTKLKD